MVMSIVSAASGQKPVWSLAVNVKLTLPAVISAAVGVKTAFSEFGLMIKPLPVVCQLNCTLLPPPVPVNTISSGAHDVPSTPASAKGEACNLTVKDAVSIQFASITERINRNVYNPASLFWICRLLPANVAGSLPAGVLTNCQLPETPNPSNVVRSTFPSSLHAS